MSIGFEKNKKSREHPVLEYLPFLGKCKGK
jgi:hypothetical protein